MSLLPTSAAPLAIAPTAAKPRRLDFEVVIAGAGMVGSTLAAALGQAGIRVGLIEGRDLSQGVGADGRASALALGTARILQRIGVWPLMEAWGVSPIHRIQVSDGESPWVAQLCRETLQAPALGYVVENQITQKALLQRIRECPSVTLFSPAQVQSFSPAADHLRVELLAQEGSRQTLRAALLVIADGARSRLREQAGIPLSRWGYGQVCIVSTLTHEHPHQQVAYERFQASGPFAILPTPDPHRSCVVWTVRQADRDWLMGLSEAEFLQAIRPLVWIPVGSVAGRLSQSLLSAAAGPCPNLHRIPASFGGGCCPYHPSAGGAGSESGHAGCGGLGCPVDRSQNGGPGSRRSGFATSLRALSPPRKRAGSFCNRCCQSPLFQPKLAVAGLASPGPVGTGGFAAAQACFDAPGNGDPPPPTPTAAAPFPCTPGTSGYACLDPAKLLRAGPRSSPAAFVPSRPSAPQGSRLLQR